MESTKRALKKYRSAVLVSLVVLFAVAYSGEASAECRECHSKNPKMVLMHKALGYKDCMKCHLNGMGKKPDELRMQRKTDARCTGCHK